MMAALATSDVATRFRRRRRGATDRSRQPYHGGRDGGREGKWKEGKKGTQEEQTPAALTTEPNETKKKARRHSTKKHVK